MDPRQLVVEIYQIADGSMMKKSWQDWVNSQFGEGIITWNTPFLFQGVVPRPPRFWR